MCLIEQLLRNPAQARPSMPCTDEDTAARRLPDQGENGVCSRLNGTDAKTAGERDAHFCETTDRTDFG